jgi:hypothetical protein
MRLLTADGIPKLKIFNSEESRPPYAILSHTWGADEDEVLFADLEQLNKAQIKRGWAKIDFARQEALRNDLMYVWVDTCCIDKTSSAELAEAINSMFRWYKNAAACFVYLADVQSYAHDDSKLRSFSHGNNTKHVQMARSISTKPDGTPLRGILKPPRVNKAVANVPPWPFLPECVEAAIRKSRWFTRGWTLQELLAPSRINVDFFSADWRYLGQLPWLAELIAEVTGIHLSLLQPKHVSGTELYSYSVAQRMSWAASRTTTRPEDIAYCLLGIFGVNMPIIYGEGHNAFFRLQQEILRTSQDQSLLAWEGGPMKHNPLLAPTPYFFAGCGDILPIPFDYKLIVDTSSVGIRANFRFLNGKAILNCHKYDNCTDAIAIEVMSLDGEESSQEFMAVRRRRTEEDSFFVTQSPLKRVILAWFDSHDRPPPPNLSQAPLAPVVMIRTLHLSGSGANHVDRSERVCILEAHPNAQWNSQRECFVLRDQAAEIGRIASTGYSSGGAPFRGRVVLQVDRKTKVEMFVDVILKIGFKKFRVAFGHRKPDDNYSSWNTDRALVNHANVGEGIELIADAYIGSLLNQEVIIVRVFEGPVQALNSIYETLRNAESKSIVPETCLPLSRDHSEQPSPTKKTSSGIIF